MGFTAMTKHGEPNSAGSTAKPSTEAATAAGVKAVEGAIRVFGQTPPLGYRSAPLPRHRRSSAVRPVDGSLSLPHGARGVSTSRKPSSVGICRESVRSCAMAGPRVAGLPRTR
jgi:hypothetical protein